MLNFYADCGFETEDELIEYVESLRDLALLSDDDDAVSSFARDLSASFAEVTESIEGSWLYVEYVSPEPLNQVNEGEGYSVEATIVSPEIVFWDPGYMYQRYDLDEYFEDIQGQDYFADGTDIRLKTGLNPDANPILKALNYSNEFTWNEPWLSTISVGLPKHGLNMSETDISQDKWVFRLFGKISGLVTADSASEAKSKFAQVVQESFSFIDSDRGTNKFSHHEFLDGQEKKTISEGSNWLIPIQHVFVNIRQKAADLEDGRITFPFNKTVNHDLAEPSGDSGETEFRNDDLRYPYIDYLSGNEEKIAAIEDDDPELFQMFEELNSYDFLTLWGDWSMDFEHPFADEAWEKVSNQEMFLTDDLSDELSEEQLEQYGWYPKRLSVRDDFLPTSKSHEYKFNIEGGDCSISAKAPQLPPDSDDQGYDEPTSLKGNTGIDCAKHEDSKECYLQKCDANLITLASGFGDGVYGVTCFDNSQGEVECVIAYFYHDHEYVENFIIANDLEIPGFIEGCIPFYLGRLWSNGEFYFGDTASWREGRDEESWSLARVEVPADEYLVLGWIDPRVSFDRVFFVGLYRNVMKTYLEKVLDFYPATKNFADDYIIFEQGITDF